MYIIKYIFINWSLFLDEIVNLNVTYLTGRGMHIILVIGLIYEGCYAFTHMSVYENVCVNDRRLKQKNINFLV